MDQINREGCGYIAIVNNIFVKYEGKEDEFEKKFGFPMYDEKGKANYDYLIVDLYASTDDKYYINESKGATALVNDVILNYIENGREEEFYEKYGCYPLTDNNKINVIARQKILDEYTGSDVAEFDMDGTTVYSIENRMKHYFNEKDIGFNCESESELTVEQVNTILDEGKSVNIATGRFNMYDENGKLLCKDVGDHWMTITGVTDDGRYIISSWGERYYLNPSELKDKSFFVIDMTV